MGDLSLHFSRFEMACNCGCGFDSMDVETLMIADDAREFVGHSITPSSAARCFAYNRTEEVGSNDDSQHPLARAMDLPVDDPLRLYQYLCEKYPDKYGFFLYNWGVHVDSRLIKARGDYRTSGWNK